MAQRIRALLRAGFQSQWGSGAWPVAPLVMHGSLSFVQPSGVTATEWADPKVGPIRTLWPRMASSRTVSGRRVLSTTTSSGRH